MNRLIKSCCNTVFIILFQGLYSLTWGQESRQAVEMADGMRANGKIYVVVGALVIIITLLFIYMFVTEKRLKSIEKEIFESQKPQDIEQP